MATNVAEDEAPNDSVAVGNKVAAVALTGMPVSLKTAMSTPGATCLP